MTGYELEEDEVASAIYWEAIHTGEWLFPCWTTTTLPPPPLAKPYPLYPHLVPTLELNAPGKGKTTGETTTAQHAFRLLDEGCKISPTVEPRMHGRRIITVSRRRPAPPARRSACWTKTARLIARRNYGRTDDDLLLHLAMDEACKLARRRLYAIQPRRHGQRNDTTSPRNITLARTVKVLY